MVSVIGMLKTNYCSRSFLDFPVKVGVPSCSWFHNRRKLRLNQIEFNSNSLLRNSSSSRMSPVAVSATADWIYDTPVHSDVEAQLRKFLLELGNDNKLLGIQVCAYKDGEVIIDTAAGVLGVDDPRPVQPDTLFNVFSVTKGITAGMMHWLVDNGKLKLDDNVANIWPEFGSNGKDGIKVNHVLNHTSGLHNALADIFTKDNPLMMADWDECCKQITLSVPETEPGKEQMYHALSFGWLCGGIIERASGKKFQDVLEEAFIRPLNVEGELYIGIPPGVESRLAILTIDEDDFKKLTETSSGDDILPIVTTVTNLCNTLNIRGAIIPAANGHCSARALARFYAALADGGIIPPPHSSLSKPPLGGHPYIPGNDSSSNGSSSSSSKGNKIFSNPRIHDQFLGVGNYEDLALQDGRFGLGFARHKSAEDGSYIGFGHAGLGGSNGLCVMKERFAIAVTLNKLSRGSTTGKIIHFVCSQLNLPIPEEYMVFGEKGADDLEKAIIN